MEYGFAIFILVNAFWLLIYLYQRRESKVFNFELFIKRLFSNAIFDNIKQLQLDVVIADIVKGILSLGFVDDLLLIRFTSMGIYNILSDSYIDDEELYKLITQYIGYNEDQFFFVNNPKIIENYFTKLNKISSQYFVRCYPIKFPLIQNVYFLFVAHKTLLKSSQDLILDSSIKFLTLILYDKDNHQKNRETYELLDNVFFKGPIPMCITDYKGEIIRSNKLLRELFEKKISKITEIIDENFYQQLLQGDVLQKEIKFETKLIKMKALPVYDQSGFVKGGVFTLVDESIQHLLYKKLESSEERYRTLVKNLPVGLLIINYEGFIYYSNDNFLQSLGINDLSEIKKRYFYDFFELTNNEIESLMKDIGKQELSFNKLISKKSYLSRTFSVNFRKIVMNEEPLIEMVFQDISLESALYSELREKSQLIEEELITARVVQEHILAIPPVYMSGMRFESFYKPSSELGGDFYDIITIDDSHIGVIIADVSGHGVSAALITSILKILIEFAPKDPHKLEEMIHYLNNGLLKIIPEDRFITLFYGVINLMTHRMEYINSGHPFPILYDDKTGNTKMLEGVGFPLGSFNNFSYDYDVRSLLLPDSCKILFYTDGLFSFKKNKQLLTKEELKDIFREHLSTQNRNILNNIYFSILKNSTRMIDDDISMLLLNVNKDLVYKNFVSLPSNVLEIDFAIIRIINEINKTLKVGEEDRWKLYTALYEAMINAVEHGNKFNVQKRVTIIYRIINDLIAFRVKDEGPGFKFNKIPNPLEGENVLKPSGRGVYMMRKIMSKIKYNKLGNEVIMFIRLKGQ